MSNLFLMVQKILQKTLQKTLQKLLLEKNQPQKNLFSLFYHQRQVKKQQALKFFLSLLICPLFLASCSWITGGSKTTLSSIDGSNENNYQNDCMDRTLFRDERGSEHLYGINCLAGKQLIIRTSQTGDEVDTFSADKFTVGSNTNNTEIPRDLDFIKPVYKVGYEFLKSEPVEQNNYDIPLLDRFLSKNEDLYGSKNTKYHILFVLKGNYLVLYKASEDKNDIPYTERTSLEKLEKVTQTSNSQGSAITRSYWKSSPYEETQNSVTSSSTNSNGAVVGNNNRQDDKDALYGVPWLGWPAKFCNVNQATSASGSVLSYFERDDCRNKPVDAQYIQVNIGDKKQYQFIDKKDLFPADFFDGNWFYGEAVSSSSNIEEEADPSPAYLVRTEKTNNLLNFIDDSGSDIMEAKYRDFGRSINALSIQWKQYKMNTIGGDKIESFSEIEDTESTATERPYFQADFSFLLEKKEKRQGSSIEEIIVDKDWISIVFSRPDFVEKIKHSFLRSSALNQERMEPRRRFRQDHQRLFGILHSSPRVILEGTESHEEKEQHHRMIHFNTNAEKEIKWYFSKQSPEEYRDLARKAVKIYNDAFQHISNGKITVTMASDTEEDKDQGDFRYNIIHLMDRIDPQGIGLLGRAPSFVNPDTGQIIGSSCNVNIEEILTDYHQLIKSYIRARLFYPKRLSPKEPNLPGTVSTVSPVVSPYLQSQIENQCDEVDKFINTKQAEKDITPYFSLDDRRAYESCAKKISKAAILNVILHEMGHNFGLSHNFKASADEDNYWKDINDINEVFTSISFIDDTNLPKSSSVMDYLPYTETPALTVLGKYDIAALRFLYMNQIEKFEGGFEKFPIERDPQVSLYNTVSNGDYKTYFHCVDGNPTNDYLCLSSDHGTTPLSIFKNKRDQTLRTLERLRYRYDDPLTHLVTFIRNGVMMKRSESTFVRNKKKYNTEINNYQSFYEYFFKKWIKLKTKYLDHQEYNSGEDNETASMYNIWVDESTQSKKYLQTIQEGLSDSYKTNILGHNNCFVSSVDDETTFESNDETPIRNCSDEKKAYRAAVKSGKVSQEENKYDLLYEFREWVIKNSIFKDWMGESMKCHIRYDGSTEEWINLEIIKKVVTGYYSDSRNFIKDCYSQVITSHLAENNLTIIGQKGKEDFIHYNDSDNEKNDWNVLPYYRLTRQFGRVDQPKSLLELILHQEPDFLSEIKNELEDRYLTVEGQYKNDLKRIRTFINQFNKFVRRQDADSSENNIIKGENEDYLKIETYSLDPGDRNSFDKKITNELSDGKAINNLTDSPYLLGIYEDFTTFNDECVKNDTSPETCKSFKSYLMEEDLVVVVVDPDGLKTIKFPHIHENSGQESFAAKRIKKYKELKKEIEEIKETASDSPLPEFFIQLITESREEKLENMF